ncbi:MAG: phospho-sugar mutase [Erysipelotrichaceae bacterium]
MNKQYTTWMEHPNIDPKLKLELEAMSEEQANDAFYTDIAFGTAGMRGLLGAGTNRINVHTITKANVGFAQYIASNGETACEQGVAIGYDNRHMSYEFALVSARVLASFNIKSYVFTSLRPTPELSFAVRRLGCFGGIMITASHNPKEYNGYKLYDAKGCQLVPALANQVIANVNAIEDPLAIAINLTPEQEQLITMIDQEVDEAYYAEVMKIQLQPEIDKSDLKVIFTPQHGTANVGVCRILDDAGYSYVLVEEQSAPDPDFSNTTTPNPEEVESYTLALDYAQKHNADIVLSCDPDADRMGVAVKTESGYQLLTGNQTGSILLEYVFSCMKEKGLMPANPVMFNTVVTSDLGEQVAKRYDVAVEKTLTGFKFIGEKIAQYEVTKEKDFVFGYEESYGYLLQPFVRDKDALQACLILCEAAAFYKAQGKSLLDVLFELYETYGTYTEKQTSLTLAGEAGSKRIQEIIHTMRTSNLKEIAGFAVVAFEDYQTLKRIDATGEVSLDFTPSDVLKFFLEDGSWIAIRPSGTEPKCKFYYCIKSTSQTDGEQKFEQYKNAIASLIA